MGKAVVRGAGRGVFVALVVLAVLTLLPRLLFSGGDLTELEDPLVVMGVPLVLVGAVLGASVAGVRHRRATGAASGVDAA